jgi:hypothetical protein
VAKCVEMQEVSCFPLKKSVFLKGCYPWGGAKSKYKGYN